MGKYILLLTFSVALTLAYFSQQSRQTSAAANEDQVERQKTVLARQIARSAFEQGISQVRRVARDVDSWPPEEEDFPPGHRKEYEEEGGEYEIDYQPQPGDGTVIVSAWGKYGDGDGVEYQINGVVSQESGASFNGMTFDGPISSVDLSGNMRVIGGENRHAMSASESAGRDALKAECGKKGGGAKPRNIRGKGGDCDIVQQDTDLSGIAETLRNKEGDEDKAETLCESEEDEGEGASLGSSKSPVFIRVEDECEVAGDVSGTGILYIEGEDEESFRMTGNSSWNGLLFFGKGENDEDGDEGDGDEGDGDEEGKPSFWARGNAKINGAAGFFGESGIDMSGNFEVEYDGDVLENVLEAFEIDAGNGGSGGGDIAVTDKCGGVLPYGEGHPCNENKSQ